jgi:asparagine synthase (glutamine-hydrolysing)
VSAIFGILRFDGAAVNPRELERMANTLAHRGPDGRKFVADGSIGLGHCLLRVNNEDLFEAQPLTDREAGLTLIADARIDNREDLAAAFGWSDEEGRDRPDSAFILAAYKKWGEDAAEHLLGDFVFAIWDGQAKKLVLSRDHMGQRQLLYHRGKDFLAFASTEAALWALAEVPRALSERVWLGVLVQDQNRAPGSTIFEGIAGLTGGTIMRVDASGQIEARRYWQPCADPAHLGGDLDHYVAAHRRVLEEAVACRLRRLAHPAGLLFSGGFDSTAIAGLAGPVMQAQKRKLLAVSLVAPEGQELEQGAPRIEWCRRDMPHLESWQVAPDASLFTTGLEASLAAIDRPLGPARLFKHPLYRHLATRGARFVMDGHGGDYTINPYSSKTALPYFLQTGQIRRFMAEFKAWRRYRKRPFLRALIIDVALPMTGAPVAGALRALRAGLPLWRPRLPVTAQVAERARAEGAKPMGLSRLANRASRAESCGRVLRRIQDGVYGPVADLPHGCAMAFSRPFHDKRVVELGLAIPEDFDLIGGRHRVLARRALSDIYPAGFAGIEKGHDRSAPDLVTTMQAVLPQLAREFARMKGDPRQSDDFDFGLVGRMIDRANAGALKGKQPVVRLARTFLLARFREAFERRNR